MRAAPTSLDPAYSSQADSFARRSLTLLMFDTLVTLDESGRVQPSLAASWQASSGNSSGSSSGNSGGNQRWQFRIRHGVKFHDGTPLTAEIAAASSARGESVVECEWGRRLGHRLSGTRS